MQSVLVNHRLEHLIFFDEEVAEDVERGIGLSQLEQRGKELAQQRPGAFDAYLQAVRPDDLATIIYTSGTTGEPKGVMLTHNNFISNVVSIGKGLPIGPTDVALSVLPLSHIFERDGFYVFLYCGVSVHYSASFDQVGENLREVAPTVMTAVPRLFEKVYHRIIKKGMSEKGFKKSVFMRSLEVGQQYGERKDKRKWISPAIVCVISFRAARRFRQRCLTRTWRREYRFSRDTERPRRASSPPTGLTTITSDRSEYRSKVSI
jgi:long-chain acyl-CoA synthetase